MAVYSDRFMVANTAASVRTGHHCGQPNDRNRGRLSATRTRAATYCRTVTTPSGPMTGKASDPTAAPIWLDKPLPSIVSTPESRARSGVAPGTALATGGAVTTGDSASVLISAILRPDRAYAK